MATLSLIAGLVLLTVSAEILVRGSVALAERLGVSPLVVGLTVVAFGTSAPELLVSLNAALSGSGSLAVGNVVGSNIANIFLILGFTALVWPIRCENPKAFLQDSSVVLAASLFFLWPILSGTIERYQGIMMVVVLLIYIVYSYWRESKADDHDGDHSHEAAEFEQLKDKPWWLIIGASLGGLVGVLVGADLLVDGAVEIARAFGVSEEVIGLTLVAFGTSLPELATSMMAALKKETELAIGNILGSCLFNILAIMGITATVVAIPVPEQVIGFDIWVMLLATVLLIPAVLTYSRISRMEAAGFLLLYFGYISIQFVGVPTL